MRKAIVGRDFRPAAVPDAVWMDLERLARVEVTSEEADHPVEAALVPGAGPSGWRASGLGEQVVRLLFDAPTTIRRIRLAFREAERARTQEFVLRWSRDGGRSHREVVRQQYHFSPPETPSEVEEYGVELAGATELELRIVPDIGGGDARASLGELRLA